MNAPPGVALLTEIDENKYRSELAIKDQILGRQYDYYCRCPAKVEWPAREAIALQLPDMVDNYPALFSLSQERNRWTWHNTLLQATTTFISGDSSTPPLPLDWMGRQSLEDLILMTETGDGDTECVGGHLCFASGWRLHDKVKQNFLRIHDEEPRFIEPIGRRVGQTG